MGEKQKKVNQVQKNVPKRKKSNQSIPSPKRVEKKIVPKQKKTLENRPSQPNQKKNQIKEKQKVPLKKRKVSNQTAKKTSSESSGKKNVKKTQPLKGKMDWNIVKLVVRSMLLAAAILLVGFLIFRFDIYEVADGQMEPTLYKTQKLMINKDSQIDRYDLVLATVKHDDKTKEVVRRVVGMPGDSIWVDGKTVFLNYSLTTGISLSPQIYASQLPTGTLSFVVGDQEALNELMGLSNIPSNQFLLLNDDFKNTADSREFGLVNANRIQGVAVYKIWPLKQSGKL